MKVLRTIDLEIPNDKSISYDAILKEVLMLAEELSLKQNWTNVHVVHDYIIKKTIRKNTQIYCYSIVGIENI